MAANPSVENVHRSEPFQWWARLGYAARGLVYAIIGFFAVLASSGRGGATTDSRGALYSFLGEPFGRVLLAVVALGLLGYSAWRLIQAVKDVDHHGADAQGLAIRGGLAVSAVLHTALALFALQLLASGVGTSGKSTQDWTATLLAQPAGQWLVGVVGLAVIGAGGAQILKGGRRRYRRYLHAPSRYMTWIDPISRYGLIARGGVFVMIGSFFLIAAYQADASEARGLAGALWTLQAQPYGSWLLLIVALGLIAFALYSFIEAVYRHMPR